MCPVCDVFHRSAARIYVRRPRSPQKENKRKNTPIAAHTAPTINRNRNKLKVKIFIDFRENKSRFFLSNNPLLNRRHSPL